MTTTPSDLPDAVHPEGTSSEPLEVGLVLRPHGLQGEVKVKLHFPESESLFHARKVELRFPSGACSERTISSVRRTGKGLLLGFEGITGCDAAESLRGCRLFVPRSELPPLEPGEYYLADLVGCRVYVGNDEVALRPLGIVREVRPDPSIDTLVIETPDGQRVEQPLADAWVGSVDVAARRLLLRNEDGLIR